MSSILLQVPQVKYSTFTRPEKCPYCDGCTFQRWGGVSKPVRDPRLQEVYVYRYHCCRCRRTFRHYPEGVDRASQTQRMKALAAIGWTFGLSYRKLVAFLSGFEVSIGRMSASRKDTGTVWRDVQAQAEQLARQKHWKPVRILGLDGAYVRGWGKIQPVLVAVDLGTGKPVALGYLDEKDPRAVRRFLEPLVQRLGISVVVTDDLVHYKTVVERLGLVQQICQFHVRRWVGRTLYELRETIPTLAPHCVRRSAGEEWAWVFAEIHQLLQELPEQGDRRLLELWRQIPESRMGRGGEELSPLDKLRYLLVRLAQDWSKYRVFDWDPEVPWTNNVTEQVIGRMKMRARTVRGYKNWPGMHNGLLLSGIRIV